MGTDAANWVKRAPQQLQGQEAGKGAASGGGEARPVGQDGKGTGSDRLRLWLHQAVTSCQFSEVTSLRVNDERFQGHFKLSGFFF